MPNQSYHRWLLTASAMLFASHDAGAQAPARNAAAQRPGKPLLEQVAAAMGGRPRILAVRTLSLEGSGETYNLGQNATPDAPLPVFTVKEYRRTSDFANRRWRVEQLREPRFPSGNPTAQWQRLGFDSVAFDVGTDGTVRRGTARADIDRANDLFSHPVGFLQLAFASGTRTTEGTSRGGMRHLLIDAAGNRFSMFVDRRTKLPVRIEKAVYHAMLGDVILATEFSEWRTADGLLLPTRTVQRLDGRWRLSDIRLSKTSVNPVVANFGVPDSIRTARAVVPPVNVTAEEIAPGVWYLAGQSHHSVAIEMSDHLLLVEAPQNEARTLAVIQKARTLRTGKPVRSVINTHHHFDHAGGVRAAMSEGLTVITHASNTAFFTELARRRHSIVPDALARSPKAPRAQGVETRLVIPDRTRRVEIHHIRGNPHAATLLMVYLPGEKLLIEADVYTPPAENATTPPAAPFAANFLENVDRLGLQVERVVPIHGRVVPISMLRAQVK